MSIGPLVHVKCHSRRRALFTPSPAPFQMCLTLTAMRGDSLGRNSANSRKQAACDCKTTLHSPFPVSQPPEFISLSTGQKPPHCRNEAPRATYLVVLVILVVSDEVLLYKQFLDHGVVDGRHGLLVALIELFLGGRHCRWVPKFTCASVQLVVGTSQAEEELKLQQ